MRDHRKGKAISTEETYRRDAFDFMLADYGIFEIACLIQYVKEPLPHELAETARWNLGHPAIVTYYEQCYPVLLPKLFRMRLLGTWTLHEDIADDPAKAHRIFDEFIGLVNIQRNDEAIETFLWFLDDGSRDGYNIADTLAALCNPDALVSRFLTPPPDRNVLDLSVRGLQNFVTICIRLDDLLQRSAGYSLFQSAQWHYYAYWFECIRDKISDGIRKALDQIVHWSPKGENEGEISRIRLAVAEYVSRIQKVFEHLLSGKYGNALRERIEKEQGSEKSRVESQAGETNRTKLQAITAKMKRRTAELRQRRTIELYETLKRELGVSKKQASVIIDELIRSRSKSTIRPRSKYQVYGTIARKTDLSNKQVSAVIEQIIKNGRHVFTVPELAKIKRVIKPVSKVEGGASRAKIMRSKRNRKDVKQ